MRAVRRKSHDFRNPLVGIRRRQQGQRRAGRRERYRACHAQPLGRRGTAVTDQELFEAGVQLLQGRGTAADLLVAVRQNTLVDEDIPLGWLMALASDNWARASLLVLQEYAAVRTPFDPAQFSEVLSSSSGSRRTPSEPTTSPQERSYYEP